MGSHMTESVGGLSIAQTTASSVENISPLVQEILQELEFEQTPFHQTLGLEFTVNEDRSVSAKFAKAPSLMGNMTRGMLHGGAISAVFDAVGGVVCAINVCLSNADLPKQEVAKKIARLCTIDLKVDYLAPAMADEYSVTGEIIKFGRSIIVVRMSMEANGRVIALGQGNFMR